ncbi:vWA domain-containing protein [Methanobrevibacter sp.]|uniref:vWA domain-containing protein n=1 Tax=Methanobrevibacter sp. TaxID=66852 RepID=UPI0025D2A5E8|nr:vWA domain-containing protein [Methanobrevibacter sp.]
MVKVDPCEQNLDLIFLIDRSGSMYGSEKDTIGGFNSFIKREKDKGLNTKVTTILFDHGYDVLYKRKDINDVCDLTSNEYYVRGSTALLDAIGRTIVTLEKEICNKVLFVIMTDGMENSSVEFSKSQISKMIKNHNWEFIFIGADIDSYAEASKIGIKRSRTANYKKSKKGVKKLYDAVEYTADCMRSNISLDDANWKKDLKEYD